MAQRPLTSVDPKFLSNLGPDEAVRLFRQLLWAEAESVGIGPTLLSVPGAITVADGGIDADINESSAASPGGLIHPGMTRYQIKTGSFSARNDSEMKDLFLKDNGKEFKERVKACFEKGGTFVAVLFGSDIPDKTDDELRIACQEFVAQREPAFKDPKIVVIRQNQIARLLDRYPALACQAQLKDFPGLRTHEEWGSEILGELNVGAAQKAFIQQIQAELRQRIANHICIWGEPGIGKTRLLFEATAVDDLSSWVAYFRSPQALEQSGVIDELVRNPLKRAILVVDDCSSRDRTSIWTQLKGLGERVRLITVQHDPCESSGTTVAIQTHVLADEQISEIIQQYDVPKDGANRYVPYCGGSPRVAHVVGSNLRSHPDDLTRPLDTENVWDRFIEGDDPPTGEVVAQRKLVLSHIALFKRFGYGQPYDNEAKAIASLVATANPVITWPRFQEIVRCLRERRILQGEATLYITPRLLHIKLWCDSWNVYGVHFDVEKFLSAIPDTLHPWFYEMFAYAHGSEAARKAVGAILSEHGFFLKSGLLNTELGANVFLSLAEADTETALHFLERTLGHQTREQLLEFRAGRQRVVWALEKIAVERAFFVRAARLLLKMAEAENNPAISNNATGTFAGLFSLGPGRTAPTQAPPVERLPVLESALYAESKVVRALALRGLDQALQTGNFTRAYGAERRGLSDLELWSPKTYDEWYDAYGQAWNLLRRRVPTLPEEEQPEAAKILLHNAFGLMQIERLEGDVSDTVSELAKLASVPRKELLDTVLFIIEHSDHLPARVKQRWQEIEKEAVGGDDFAARLRRQVTLPVWRLAPSTGLSSEPWRPLAQEAVQNRRELLPQLPWLMTVEAESSTVFGYELGKADRDYVFERSIISAVEIAGPSGNYGLLGGYLRAMHEADPARWLTVLEDLSEEPHTKWLFPGVVMQSGLTDEASRLLTRLIVDGDMPAHHLEGFIFGGEVRNLSANALESWIELLLNDQSQRSVVTALRLLHYFCLTDHAKAQLQPPLVESVLLHEALFEKEGSDTRAAHRDFDWSELARRFLEDHPDRKLIFARRLLESMGLDSVVLPRFGHSYAHQVLDKIAEEHPREIWAIVGPMLGPPVDTRAHTLMNWLRGDLFGKTKDVQSLLTLLPLQDLWNWVDEDVEHRAWYLARFIPNEMFTDPQKICLAREILIRYGDRDDVQRNLIGNFSSEGWVGPASAHFQSKKEALEKLREAEAQPRVREWLQKYIAYLHRSVEQARIEEERESF